MVKSKSKRDLVLSMPKWKNKLGARGSRPRPARRKKARIAIVGAGRIGTALGCALNEIGYRIEVVVTQHAASAGRAAQLISADILWLTSRQLDRLKPAEYDRIARCDLILIATPDDVIASVAQQLVRILNLRASRGQAALSKRRFAIHVSGALASEVLQPLRKAGFATASLHPLVSVSNSLSSNDLFRGAFFCIEGERSALGVARSIAHDLGGKSFTIDPNSKALYHAAAVTASGHVVVLFDIALEMLGRCGLSPRRAQKVLLPLLESTVTNLSTNDPAHALTGTFARGDLTTVTKHLAAIESQKLRDALAAYVLLGQRSLSLAKGRAGFDQIAGLLA
ncbi:MAG TPA: Rossmann-like and DUF2520 domain-containing protein, partial [Pyrinomonadaceae bacterium]|nr:Rossmann-like and DUF2520 domain-containing protein [Pyrinomonadaceae bacterium]